jgi:hypothetical protein
MKYYGHPKPQLIPTSKVKFYPLIVLLLMGWSWVIGAKKGEGDYRVVLNSHSIEDHFCFL